MNIKRPLTLALALVTSAWLGASAQAQVFRPETVSGAVLGGLAGAVMGNNSGDLGHNAWRGAAIGTAAGALLGSAVGAERESREWRNTQVPPPVYVTRSPSIYARRPVTYVSDTRWDSPVRYDHRRRETNPRVTGALLGGLAGAIIGHNDGRHGWEGAAYGAGAGLILGSIWDRADRRRDDRVREVRYIAPAVETAPTAAPTAVPTTITINNYYYGPASGASSANALFGR